MCIVAGFSMDPINNTTSLWLVRHGEPDVHAHEICCPAIDTGLSEMGRSQIAAAGKYLKAWPITTIYCSPLRRAMESAKMLAGICSCPLEVVSDLRELDFGGFTGLTLDQIAQRDAAFADCWMKRPTSVTFPNGEAFRDMRSRVLGSVKAVRRDCSGRVTAIVGHAGVNRVLIANALGLQPANLFRLGQDYGALSLLRFFGEMSTVELVNYRPCERDCDKAS